MNVIYAGSGTLLLGKQGENNALMVRFPIKSLLEAYGELSFRLAVRRPGDVLPYSVTPTVGDMYAEWTVDSYDTALAGVGRCELQCFDEDGTVVKSDVWATKVAESITGGGTIKNSSSGGGGSSGGGSSDDVATDEEVSEALDDLFNRGKTEEGD